MMIKSAVFCSIVMLFFLRAHSQDDPDIGLLKHNLGKSRPDTNRVRLLLDLGSVYFDNSSNSQERLDTAGIYAAQAIKLSTSLKYKSGLASALIVQSNVYRKRGAAALAQRYLDSGINMIKLRGDPVQLGNAYLATWYRYVQDADAYQLQMRSFKMAFDILSKSHAKLPLANALYRIGELYRYAGDNKIASTYLKQALEIYQQEKFPRIYLTYEAIAWNMVQMGDIPTGLEYDLKAAAIAEKLQVKSLTLSIIYNGIGIMSFRQNMYDRALYYYKKALVVAEYNRNEDHIRNLYTNIAMVQLRTGKIAAALKSLQIFKKYPPTDVNMKVKGANMLMEVYLRLNDFGNAEKYYRQLAQIDRDKVASADVKERLLHGMITYLQTTHQFRASIPYLKLYESYSKNTGNPAKMAEEERLVFKTDSGLGNYLSAIRHHEQYKILSDSVLNTEKAKQFNQLTLKFETEKKDRELTVNEQHIRLLNNQAQLQQQVLQHEKGVKNVVFAGIILLTALFCVGFSRYRLKQKTNQKLEKQQAEINDQNNTLQILLEEKEWLLKEIHHRVKNNLQIVISLLNTQSSYLENVDALAAIRNSQHRMHAMSLIHQKLYQSDNLAEIDLPVYITELAGYLKESYNEREIAFRFDLCPLKVDVGHAVPLGLILNETISNAMKYAFTGNKTGHISIRLQRIKEGDYQLQVQDDGKGLPEDFDIYQSNSLGMSLMNGLARQLEGSLELSSNNGLMVTINFRLITNML